MQKKGNNLAITVWRNDDLRKSYGKCLDEMKEIAMSTNILAKIAGKEIKINLSGSHRALSLSREKTQTESLPQIRTGSGPFHLLVRGSFYFTNVLSDQLLFNSFFY